MAKFYKVIKDHPYWEVGAIVSDTGPEKNGRNYYKAINELWIKDIEKPGDLNEYPEVVEGSTEFFERVYEVSLATKVKYLAKDAAREAVSKFYKS